MRHVYRIIFWAIPFHLRREEWDANRHAPATWSVDGHATLRGARLALRTHRLQLGDRIIRYEIRRRPAPAPAA